MMTSAAESTAGPGAGAGRDVIDHLAGIAPGSRLAELRAQRPDVVRYAQGSYEALLEPADLAGVSRREREAVALRVAVLTPSPALVAWHSAPLQELAGEDLVRAVVEQGAEARASRRARRRSSDTPTSWRPRRVGHAGEYRGVEGGRPDPARHRDDLPVDRVREFPGARPGRAAPLRGGSMSTTKRFTQEVVKWQPWVETVDDVGATPEQAELVPRSRRTPIAGPTTRRWRTISPRFRSAPAFSTRSCTGHGGASRADREFATVVPFAHQRLRLLRLGPCAALLAIDQGYRARPATAR